MRIAAAFLTVALAALPAGTAFGAPLASVSPTTLPFGSVAVGGHSDQLITVKNVGTGLATITGFTWSGAGTSSFSRVFPPATPFTPGAGASQPITVRCAPVGPGARSATLTIGNDTGVMVTVSVSGAGVAGAPIAGPGSVAMMGLLTLISSVVVLRRRRVDGSS